MQSVKRRAFQRDIGITRKHSWALAVAGTHLPNEPSKPHLSLCLRVLSRRRTPAGRKPSASLSRCCPRHAVLLPESFRGGCSFGAGALADLSRRDCLEHIGGNTTIPRLSTRLTPLSRALVCCSKSMISLHSFWTLRHASSKSVAPEQGTVFEASPAKIPIG